MSTALLTAAELEANNQALRQAAQQGNIAELQSLLPLSDANASTSDGWTALHYAAHWGKIESIQALLPVSEVKATKGACLTALHLASRHGHADCIQALLLVSDAKALNKGGKTALDLAKEEGHDDCARLIEAHLAELEGAEIAGYIKKESAQELPKQKARSL